MTTIKNADQIIVMKLGEVLERGTHDELSQLQDGLYASMWAKQSMVDKGKRIVA